MLLGERARAKTRLRTQPNGGLVVVFEANESVTVPHGKASGRLIPQRRCDPSPSREDRRIL